MLRRLTTKAQPRRGKGEKETQSVNQRWLQRFAKPWHRNSHTFLDGRRRYNQRTTEKTPRTIGAGYSTQSSGIKYSLRVSVINDQVETEPRIRIGSAMSAPIQCRLKDKKMLAMARAIRPN